jgi:2-C-methyl-D-erythritol 2,4-cyclodiphosphate synthase
MSPGEGAGVGYRVGQGYDVHRLVTGRELVLGGVTLPWDLGLEGHSDGDAVCHAVIDAVLGAAGAGDIGQHFPDDDPKFHNARSIELLRSLRPLLDSLELAVVNVDVTVVLEVPRLGPYRDEMVRNLATALGVDASRVGLKATSNERLGAIGAGEAIAALAVALLSGKAAP